MRGGILHGGDEEGVLLVVLSGQGLQADLLGGAAVVLAGRGRIVEVGCDEWLRLTREVAVWAARGREGAGCYRAGSGPEPFLADAAGWQATRSSGNLL